MLPISNLEIRSTRRASGPFVIRSSANLLATRQLWVSDKVAEHLDGMAVSVCFNSSSMEFGEDSLDGGSVFSLEMNPPCPFAFQCFHKLPLSFFEISCRSLLNKCADFPNSAMTEVPRATGGGQVALLASKGFGISSRHILPKYV